MDPSSFLKSLEILSDLNDQEISFLASKAQWIDYEPSAPVIKRGEIGRDSTVLYAHLGGQPALNGYSALFS